MYKVLLSLLFVCLLPAASAADKQSLNSKLHNIQQKYNVPGMALLISKGGVNQPLSFPLEFYSGVVSTENEIEVNSDTYFPMASLSKVFSSYAALELAKTNKLSLDDPIVKWLPKSKLSDKLSLKHLLSHRLVSNKERHGFFYDQRFSYLGKILSQANDKSFEQTLVHTIETHFSKDIIPYTKHALNKLGSDHNFAIGHAYSNGNKVIPHDFGLSASAGLATTGQGLVNAGVHLIKTYTMSTGKNHVFTQHDSRSLYSNGFFKHIFNGLSVLWSYGQYDGYASLWIIVPDQELQLVMFANNNTLSDASRLIFGDITSSPVANLFFEHFLCNASDCDVSFDKARAELHRLTYFSRWNKDDYYAALQALNGLYGDSDSWKQKGDLNLLFISGYLHAVSNNLGYSSPSWNNQELTFVKSLPNTLTDNLPYWLYYSGNVYDRNNLQKEALSTFTRLVSLENIPNHWTVQEAKVILASSKKSQSK